MNGKKMYRSYTVPVSQELLDDPSSSAGQISAVLNNRKLAAEHYFAEINREEAESRLVDVSLSIPDREGEGYRYLDMDEAGRTALLEAVQADIAAGRLGRRYLLDNQERYENCYYNDLHFMFQMTGEDNVQGYYAEQANISYDYSTEVVVTLQTGATQTMAVLSRYGVKPEDLVTLVDWAQRGREQAELEKMPTTEIVK